MVGTGIPKAARLAAEEMGSTCPRPAHFRDVTLGPKCDSCAKTGGVPGVESADSCLMSRQGCGAHYQFGWLQGIRNVLRRNGFWLQRLDFNQRHNGQKILLVLFNPACRK